MAKRLKNPAKGYDEWSVQPILDRAFKLYLKKYGEHAPLPDTAPELGKQYVHFFREEKRLCRFNLLTSGFDQESKAVRNALLIKQATKKYLRKYGKSEIYPDGSPVVRGVYVCLMNGGKPLCRYNIHSQKIDLMRNVMSATDPKIKFGLTDSDLSKIEKQLKQSIFNEKMKGRMN